LADNSGPIRDFGLPVISNTGVVAFSATLDNDQQAIMALVDGTLTTVADSNVAPEFNNPSISKNGTIAFSAREAGSGPGLAVLAWRDGQLTTVVDRADGPFIDLNTRAAVSERNTVAFWAKMSDGFDVIATRAISGGPIEVIASQSRGVTPDDQSPDINARGSVVFGGAPVAQGGEALFLSTAQSLRTILDSSGPFHVFSGGPSINDSGAVVVHANLDSGDKGIFKVSSKGDVRPFAIDGDVIRDVRQPAINNRGEVAFIGTIVAGTGGRVGIFTGPNPETDKVVALGDNINGFTIDGLNFFKGLNDKGEIVFWAASNDGRRCLGLAGPVQ